MLISKNCPNHYQPQFKSEFIINDKYKKLLLFAKKQKNYSEFQNIINQIQLLGNFDLKINYGREMTLAPCDYGGDLKRGLVPEILSTFFSITKNNKKGIKEVVEYAYKNMSPLEYAYKKILSLGDITTQLYQQLFTENFNPLKNYSKSAEEIAKKEVNDIEEQSLVSIVKKWDKIDSDIFKKFKSQIHTYPEQKHGNKIYEKMSILEYLNAVKKDRFFDFNSELMNDKCTYYDYRDLAFELEKERKRVTSDEIEKFLYDISQDKKLGRKMIREFSDNKNNPEDIKQALIKLLGNNESAYEKFYKWYHDEQIGYKKAYSDYYNDLYEKAKSLMTIVKQSPNVAPWAFLNKAKELGIEPTLGKLPKEYGNIDDFRLLIKELIKIDKDTNNNSFKKKYPYYKEIQYYITIDGKKFEVEKLRGGMSAKTKYKVTPENGDTYIIKFNEYDAIGNTWRSTQIRENQAMRADSPYLDALVDFYLKANGCKNAADVKFFDYKSKAVVYKVTKGEKPNFDNDMFNNLYTFNNSKLAEDIKGLGIILNDVNDGNFLKDSKGRNVLIDTGHAEYNHPFRPMVIGKHISLSNLCGRDLK